MIRFIGCCFYVLQTCNRLNQQIMKKLIVLLCLVQVMPIAYAQQDQYIIRYDLSTNQQDYIRIRNGKDSIPVSVINLNRSKQVTLHLKNLPGSFRDSVVYAYQPGETERVSVPWGGLSLFSGLLSKLEGSMVLKKISTDADYSGQEVNKDVKSNKDDSRKRENIALSKVAQKRSALKVQYNNFVASYSQWVQAYAYEQNCKDVWADLSGLRYNVQYPAEKIKAISRKIINDLLPGAADNPDVFLITTGQNFRTRAGVALEEAYQAFGKALLEYEETDSMNRDKGILDSMRQGVQLVWDYTSSVSMNEKEEKTAFYQQQIVKLYKQITRDSYYRTVPITVHSKTTAAIVRFTPVIDSATMRALNISGNGSFSREIPIHKKAPLRFRNTLGLSFVYFGENRWHYFVKQQNNENVISRENGDLFQPMLTTFLHFYSPRDRGFRWGGSIGAGLPIAGSDNSNESLNILAGLSTLMGKNDPLCLTVGVSGARIKKLSGLETGEVVNFTELRDSHYKKVYRIGYFFSVTFNMAALNTRE